LGGRLTPFRLADLGEGRYHVAFVSKKITRHGERSIREDGVSVPGEEESKRTHAAKARDAQKGLCQGNVKSSLKGS